MMMNEEVIPSAGAQQKRAYHRQMCFKFSTDPAEDLMHKTYIFCQSVRRVKRHHDACSLEGAVEEPIWLDCMVGLQPLYEAYFDDARIYHMGDSTLFLSLGASEQWLISLVEHFRKGAARKVSQQVVDHFLPIIKFLVTQEVWSTNPTNNAPFYRRATRQKGHLTTTITLMKQKVTVLNWFAGNKVRLVMDDNTMTFITKVLLPFIGHEEELPLASATVYRGQTDQSRPMFVAFGDGKNHHLECAAHRDRDSSASCDGDMGHPVKKIKVTPYDENRNEVTI